MALHRPPQDNSFEKSWFRYGRLSALQPRLEAAMPGPMMPDYPRQARCRREAAVIGKLSLSALEQNRLTRIRFHGSRNAPKAAGFGCFGGISGLPGSDSMAPEMPPKQPNPGDWAAPGIGPFSLIDGFAKTS